MFLLASTHFRWVTKKITVKIIWHPQPALNSHQDKTEAKNIKNETKIKKKNHSQVKIIERNITPKKKKNKKK